MSDIKETVIKFANTITKTSGEIVKTTKLSISLSSEEDKLKTMYAEIGKKVHEIYMYGGSIGAAFDDQIKLVETQREKIDNLRNQINIVKGNKDCAKCGKTMEKNAEFCPKCGHRAADAAYADVTEPPAGPPQAENAAAKPFWREEAAPVVEVCAEVKKVCSLCGKENNKESKFCYHCGRVI